MLSMFVGAEVETDLPPSTRFDIGRGGNGNSSMRTFPHVSVRNTTTATFFNNEGASLGGSSAHMMHSHVNNKAVRKNSSSTFRREEQPWWLAWRLQYDNAALEDEFCIYYYMNRALTMAWSILALVVILVMLIVAGLDTKSRVFIMNMCSLFSIALIVLMLYYLEHQRDGLFPQWCAVVARRRSQVLPGGGTLAGEGGSDDTIAVPLMSKDTLWFSPGDVFVSECSAPRCLLRRNAKTHEVTVLLFVVAFLLTFTGSDFGREPCWGINDPQGKHDACLNNFMYSVSLVYFFFGTVGGMMLRMRVFLPLATCVALYCGGFHFLPGVPETTVAFRVSAAIIALLVSLISIVAMYHIEVWHRDAFFQEVRASSIIERLILAKLQAKRLASASVAFDVEKLLSTDHQGMSTPSNKLPLVPIRSSVNAVVCVLRIPRIEAWSFCHSPNEIVNRLNALCSLTHSVASRISLAREAGKWRLDGRYQAFRVLFADEMTVAYFPDAESDLQATIQDSFEFAAVCVGSTMMTTKTVHGSSVSRAAAVQIALSTGPAVCTASHEHGVVVRVTGRCCEQSQLLGELLARRIAFSTHPGNTSINTNKVRQDYIAITAAVASACAQIEGFDIAKDVEETATSTPSWIARQHLIRVVPQNQAGGAITTADIGVVEVVAGLMSRVENSRHNTSFGSPQMRTAFKPFCDSSVNSDSGAAAAESPGLDASALRRQPGQSTRSSTGQVDVLSPSFPLESSRGSSSRKGSGRFETAAVVATSAALEHSPVVDEQQQEIIREDELVLPTEKSSSRRRIAPFRSFVPETLESSYIKAHAQLPSRERYVSCGLCGLSVAAVILLILFLDVLSNDTFVEDDSKDGKARFRITAAMMGVCCAGFAAVIIYNSELHSLVARKHGVVSRREALTQTCAMFVLSMCYVVGISMAPKGSILASSRALWCALLLCISFSNPLFYSPPLAMALDMIVLLAMLMTQVANLPSYAIRSVRSQVMQTCFVIFYAVALRMIQDHKMRHLFLVRNETDELALLTKEHLRHLDRILSTLAPNEALATTLLKSMIQKRALLTSDELSMRARVVRRGGSFSGEFGIDTFNSSSSSDLATTDVLDPIETKPQDRCVLYFEVQCRDRQGADDDSKGGLGRRASSRHHHGGGSSSATDELFSPTELAFRIAKTVKGVSDFVEMLDEEAALPSDSRNHPHGAGKKNQRSKAFIFSSVDPVSGRRGAIVASSAFHLRRAAAVLVNRFVAFECEWKVVLGYGPIAGAILGGVCSAPRRNAQAPVMRFDLYGACACELREVASMMEWNSVVATRRFIHQVKVDPFRTITVAPLCNTWMETEEEEEEEDSPNPLSSFRCSDGHMVEVTFITAMLRDAHVS